MKIRVIGQPGIFVTEEEVRAATGDIIHITKFGMHCENKEQSDGRCLDYGVRFCCFRCVWTDWLDRDNPSGNGEAEV
jgi:hypothetical protein